MSLASLQMRLHLKILKESEKLCLEGGLYIIKTVRLENTWSKMGND